MFGPIDTADPFGPSEPYHSGPWGQQSYSPLIQALLGSAGVIGKQTQNHHPLLEALGGYQEEPGIAATRE